MGWHIVSQAQVSGLDSTGHYVQGVNVTFTLDGNGQTGTVFVPLSSYNADTVKQRVDEFAQHLINVANLRG